MQKCDRCEEKLTIETSGLCSTCYLEIYNSTVIALMNGEVPKLDDCVNKKKLTSGITMDLKETAELFDRKTHAGICSELNETYRKKNNDYGNSFKKSYDEFGIVSAVVRMTDKMERLKALTTGVDNLVKEESVEDTILDLANYAIMTVIELRNRR